MTDDRPTIRTMYDRLAGEYTRHVADELDHKPLDRELLDRFAASVHGDILDLGCGPGHVAAYLHARGARVSGVDLSPEMIARARELAPGIAFREGNMLALDVPTASYAGVVAFYAIVNLPDADIARGCRELARVLAPGGLALVAFHIGNETLHVDELWGVPIDLDFFLLDPATIHTHLAAAGLVIEETTERDPYPDVEYQSRRAYVLARKRA